MKKPVLQRIIAIVLIGAGVVWSIMFPKSMSLHWDMVLSTGIGIGLVGTGLLVMCGNRKRLPILTLATLLLWSLVANAYLLAWQDDIADAGMEWMAERRNQPMQADQPSAER
jgi:hypothetical protein